MMFRHFIPLPRWTWTPGTGNAFTSHICPYTPRQIDIIFAQTYVCVCVCLYMLSRAVIVISIITNADVHNQIRSISALCVGACARTESRAVPWHAVDFVPRNSTRCMRWHSTRFTHEHIRACDVVHILSAVISTGIVRAWMRRRSTWLHTYVCVCVWVCYNPCLTYKCCTK